jgi:hypothetical protein
MINNKYKIDKSRDPEILIDILDKNESNFNLQHQDIIKNTVMHIIFYFYCI